MLPEPRLKLEEAELLLNPPPLLKALLLRELGERETERLLETRSPPPLGLVDGLLALDGRFAFEGLFDGLVEGLLAEERSPPGRLACDRSPPGRLLGCCDGRLRSPPGRLLFGPPRSVPPNFSAVFRFE
jgi:hypothetical protein